MNVSSRLPRFQRRVDGVVLPATVATHPALDFCNTLAGWNAPEQHEYLVDYAHLAVWAREGGLVDHAATRRLLDEAERDPDGAARQLRGARLLRGALYSACRDAADAKAWRTVAEGARTAATHAVLTAGQPPGRRWAVADTSLARPVLEIARTAGDLLATIELDHVKACPGTGCGWLFLDPRGRRRWCTMEVCGNRAKARRHAARVRASAHAGGAGA